LQGTFSTFISQRGRAGCRAIQSDTLSTRGEIENCQWPKPPILDPDTETRVVKRSGSGTTEYQTRRKGRNEVKGVSFSSFLRISKDASDVTFVTTD